ncbi:unnamed protein product, partial [Ixodes pacificus]
MPRWFFNVDTGVCERFIYGGCGGNANNYLSFAECERSCLRRAGTLLYVSCYAKIQCATKTLMLCEKASTLSPKRWPKNYVIEHAPLKPGVCDAYMPRWFFNVNTGACERFIYGGCGGNANNYHSFAECERTC